MQSVHKTVLLKEAVEALHLKPGMIVVDATLGGGGHSLEVLKKIGPNGKLVAFDQDLDAIARFEMKISAIGGPAFGWKVGRVLSDENIKLFHDNYATLKDRLTLIGISHVDAILADLGISSDQLADKKRGISFQGDSPLDMRMDMTQGITAADVVNTYSQQDLVRILKEFGDEQFANSIAKNIVAQRISKPFERTEQLVELIEKSVSGEYKRKKLHFATKTFQALRIEVNQELKTLQEFLLQAIEVLRTGGRLAVITFHSGEDVVVKYTLRENARGCICPPEFPVCRCNEAAKIKLITRKAILPSDEEISENPRARSAKLRVCEKIKTK
ncbi:MAG: 16S rRNA (cytosine(1402)-N(4))-methyltransferase RsmH [bacterium]